MREQANIAVFASGNGSNFQAMLENDSILEKIVLLICDKPGAKVIERAHRYRIPTLVVRRSDFETKKAYEQKIHDWLQQDEVTWIFLAGYMRLIGPTILDPFAGRIVNIHPSLLPAFPGKDAIGEALRAGVSETGVTIHYVDAGMDTGSVIIQQTIPIFPEDTYTDLQTRLQKTEHVLYPETIHTLIMENRTDG